MSAIHVQSSLVQIDGCTFKCVCIVMMCGVLSIMPMSYDARCAAVITTTTAPTLGTTPTPLPKANTLTSDQCASSNGCCLTLNTALNISAKINPHMCKSATFDSKINKFGRLESTAQLLGNEALPDVQNKTLYKCRYDLLGAENERVQIKFLDFFMPPASLNASREECALNNSLQVLSLVRNKYEVTETVCGHFLPKPIMSVGSELVLQFVGQVPDTKFKFYGFRAEYRFVKNFGISTGEQIDGDNCSFVYNSTIRKSGWFNSPNFPGFYPHNIICNYYFYAEFGEHVNIRFINFDVEGIDNCEVETASDYVEFSNFISIDRKFTKFCGKHEKLTIRSDDKFFRIKFSSNDRFDKTGFRAMYDFENESLHANISSMESYISCSNCSLCTTIFVYLLVLMLCNYLH